MIAIQNRQRPGFVNPDEQHRRIDQIFLHRRTESAQLAKEIVILEDVSNLRADALHHIRQIKTSLGDAAPMGPRKKPDSRETSFAVNSTSNHSVSAGSSRHIAPRRRNSKACRTRIFPGAIEIRLLHQMVELAGGTRQIPDDEIRSSEIRPSLLLLSGY